MKHKRNRYMAFVALALMILVGCGGDEPATSTPATDLDRTVSSDDTPSPSPTPQPLPEDPVYGEAVVESVQVVILESFPVQVRALVRGQLPDGCTNIHEVTTERDGLVFEVLITTVRAGGSACTEALVPFEESISLDVLGLEAGSYTVSVNGIAGSFTLDIDNSPQTEETATQAPEATATATPEPVDPESASISGTVWHDLCSVQIAAGEQPALPSEGCISAVDGETFQANGLLESGEPGISGLLVTLSEGICPGEEVASALTGDDGFFSFTDLAAGTYCLSVDALSDYNSAVLVPGAWTYPNSDVDNATIVVSEEEVISDADFGWDYQFLPLPEVDPQTCLNSIEFVEDLSIPDDSILEPGDRFVKSWRLRNIGTCPWSTDYSLTRVSGDGMSEEDSIPLPSAVAPGQSIELSVPLTAPAIIGTYRDNWQLSNAEGELFGVGGFVEEPFWVQIIVSEPEPTPIPGSAIIGGVVWYDLCRLLQDGTPSAGCIEQVEDSGIFIGDGSFNFNEIAASGLIVVLGSQACPEEGSVGSAETIATAVTDDDGLYRFPELDEGTYCVAIDAFDETNLELLIPGDWTWPAPGVGRLTVFLDAGESLLDIDFGWDDRSD